MLGDLLPTFEDMWSWARAMIGVFSPSPCFLLMSFKDVARFLDLAPALQLSSCFPFVAVRWGACHQVGGGALRPGGAVRQVVPRPRSGYCVNALTDEGSCDNLEPHIQTVLEKYSAQAQAVRQDGMHLLGDLLWNTVFD